MIILRTGAELHQWRVGRTGSVGFVPTMGHLHQGHLSLIRRSRSETDTSIVSIFINPLQFHNEDDLQSYPRTIELDSEQLDSLNVDALFLPSAEEIYPDQFATTIRNDRLANLWEGKYRPGHFDGVCTIVTKLFNLVQPTVAYFGEKDYQQLVVIKAMVQDLNIPVSIASCPTVREEDGLAYSSRNSLIDGDRRPSANAIYLQLKTAAVSLKDGRPSAKLLLACRNALEKLGFVVDYFALVDAESLNSIAVDEGDSRLLAAAHLGNVRLIDNIPVV